MSDNHSGHKIATKKQNKNLDTENTNQGTLVVQHNIKTGPQYQEKLRLQNQKKNVQRRKIKDGNLHKVGKEVRNVVKKMIKMFEGKKTTVQQGKKQTGQSLQRKQQQGGQKQTGQRATVQQGKQQTGQPQGQKQTGQRATVQQGKQQTGQPQGQKQTGQRATVQQGKQQTGQPQGQKQTGKQQTKQSSDEIKTLIKELKNLYFIRRTQEEKKNVKNILEHIKHLGPTEKQIEQINRVLKSKDRRFPKVSKLLLGGQTIYQMYSTYNDFITKTQQK
jgi:hypothetical protein